MYKMLRNHGSLKQGQLIDLEGVQKDIFISCGFAELVKEEDLAECKGCEDDVPCSECEEYAKSKQVEVEEPKKKRTKKAPK